MCTQDRLSSKAMEKGKDKGATKYNKKQKSKRHQAFLFVSGFTFSTGCGLLVFHSSHIFFVWWNIPADISEVCVFKL